MKFKKTRIAFSALCGILCLLLIGLWVRSYWWADSVRVPISRTKVLNFYSTKGWLTLLSPLGQPRNATWRINHQSQETIRKSEQAAIASGATVVHRMRLLGLHGVHFDLPHALAALLLAGFAVAPLIPSSPRFRLKTLLIAITILSLLLGYLTYLAKM